MADMEQHLLVLQPEAPDAEQLNAIFRAAHSIKGGAGTFWLQRFAGNHASDGKPAR
ncbi:Hpt domain-containing protein [Escherichia coli]|nr:Hpt domain-containing protein [Escherichia coli]